MSQRFTDHVLATHRGQNKRSPFPEFWTDEEVLDVIDLIIAMPQHTEWRGDRLFFDGRVQGILVRVIYRTDEGVLWTAYPPEDQSLRSWELG